MPRRGGNLKIKFREGLIFVKSLFHVLEFHKEQGNGKYLKNLLASTHVIKKERKECYAR